MEGIKASAPRSYLLNLARVVQERLRSSITPRWISLCEKYIEEERNFFLKSQTGTPSTHLHFSMCILIQHCGLCQQPLILMAIASLSAILVHCLHESVQRLSQGRTKNIPILFAAQMDWCWRTASMVEMLFFFRQVLKGIISWSHLHTDPLTELHV